MNDPQPTHPSAFLRELFLERKERNSSYSTRAFARDLGISQALLSLVMNGKRPLTLKQATQIAILLEFDQKQTLGFLEMVLRSLPASSRVSKSIRLRGLTGPGKSDETGIFKNQQIEAFKLISQWYHLPILDLTTTSGFKNDSTWIARRLGISPIQAQDAVERLLNLGLLKKRAGKLRKSDKKIFFGTQRSEVAVRTFHQQMIGKALNQLEKNDAAAFASREISGITMAIPKSAWPKAKEKIQKFQKELAEELCAGDGCDEVYQLNVQMFPLTQPVS